MGEDPFGPMQEQVDELLTSSVVGRTANLPTASNSQNVRLVAIELICKLRFGARIEARACARLPCMPTKTSRSPNFAEILSAALRDHSKASIVCLLICLDGTIAKFRFDYLPRS